MPTSVQPLPEVVALASAITERIIWCTLTTVSASGEPRSRIIHPVWDWSGPVPTALLASRRTPIKTAHLAGNPRVSCFYWDPAHDTVAIDASAEWVEPDQHHQVWNQILQVPPPVGFDPAMIWPDGPSSPDAGFIRVRATRIVATAAGQEGVRSLVTG